MCRAPAGWATGRVPLRILWVTPEVSGGAGAAKEPNVKMTRAIGMQGWRAEARRFVALALVTTLLASALLLLVRPGAGAVSAARAREAEMRAREAWAEQMRAETSKQPRSMSPRLGPVRLVPGTMGGTPATLYVAPDESWTS
jgi:hypothetical protein